MLRHTVSANLLKPQVKIVTSIQNSLLLLYFTMLLYVLHDDVVVFHVAVVLRAVVVVFAIVVLQVVVFAILSHEKLFLSTTDVNA